MRDGRCGSHVDGVPLGGDSPATQRDRAVERRRLQVLGVEPAGDGGREAPNRGEALRLERGHDRPGERAVGQAPGGEQGVERDRAEILFELDVEECARAAGREGGGERRDAD